MRRSREFHGENPVGVRFLVIEKNLRVGVCRDVNGDDFVPLGDEESRRRRVLFDHLKGRGKGLFLFVPVEVKEIDGALRQVSVGGEELRAIQARMEREESHGMSGNLKGRLFREGAKIGRGPEFIRDVFSLFGADFREGEGDLRVFVGPVEEGDDVPVAEGTTHFEIPDGKVVEVGIEGAGTHVADGKSLLKDLHSVGGKFVEEVAEEGLLTRQSDDRRGDSRFFKGQIADQNRVRVGDEDDVVHEVLIEGAPRLLKDVFPLDGLIRVDDIGAGTSGVGV